jgi:hypothetical protein
MPSLDDSPAEESGDGAWSFPYWRFVRVWSRWFRELMVTKTGHMSWCNARFMCSLFLFW